MRKPFRSAFVAGLAVLALTAAGCSSAAPAGNDDASDSDSPEALTSVTYLTSFNTFGRDAYAFVALEKGFFEDAGFDVEIQPASGKADFGVGDFQAAALTIANEQIPVRIVSAIQDKSLAAIATAEGYGISEPKDLEGKKIADQPGSVNEVLFPVYAEAAGIDASKVTFVPAQPSALPQLLASRQVDAIGQFVVADGLIRGATGKAGVFLPFSDYLDDLYGNALFASEERAADDPDSIARFNEALHEGLEYAIENPEEAGEILAKYQPTQKADVAAGEIAAMTPYVGDATSNGVLDPARVDAILALLFDAGAIKAEPDASTIVAPVK